MLLIAIQQSLPLVLEKSVPLLTLSCEIFKRSFEFTAWFNQIQDGISIGSRSGVQLHTDLSLSIFPATPWWNTGTFFTLVISIAFVYLQMVSHFRQTPSDTLPGGFYVYCAGQVLQQPNSSHYEALCFSPGLRSFSYYAVLLFT